jgi:DNA polymerase-1
MVLVTADYSQAELRVLCTLAKSEAMAEIYRKGGDLHDIVCKRIFGEGYTKRERMIGKAIVFGLVYGRSVANIAETFGIAVEEAAEYQHDFLDRFDGIRAWIAKQHEFVTTYGYVENPLGLRRRFPLITYNNVAEVKRQAVNTPVQGTSSHLMAISMTRLLPYVESIGGHILFPLHDSIMFELPIDYWKAAAVRIIDMMEAVPIEVMGNFVPFTADCDVGWRWGELTMHEFKRKGSQTVNELIADYVMEPEPTDWYKELVWE